MKSPVIAVLLAGISCATGRALADSVGNGEIGTVAACDNTGVIRFVPWGKTDADVKQVATKANTEVFVAVRAARITDLEKGMWIRFDVIGSDGVAKRVTSGQFITGNGDKIVIFKDMPAEFLQRDVKDWYSNEAGGVRFKVQLMRGKGIPGISGANLRPASYQEPAGGFVFYLPAALKGTVLNYNGAKPGTTVPDAEGKIVINRDSVTESYWKHPKNPNKLDLGPVSGLTELTLRKFPKADPFPSRRDGSL